MEIQEYIKLEKKIIDFVTKYQDAGHVTIRRIAKRFGIKQDLVIQVVEDVELNLNVGWGTASGYIYDERQGDWTVENLNP